MNGLEKGGGHELLIQHPVFDPLDLEIIDLVYEAACAHLVARYPDHDPEKDEERQTTLRKRLFALAEPGPVDFDVLCDRVLATMPEYCQARPGCRDMAEV